VETVTVGSVKLVASAIDSQFTRTGVELKRIEQDARQEDLKFLIYVDYNQGIVVCGLSGSLPEIIVHRGSSCFDLVEIGGDLNRKVFTTPYGGRVLDELLQKLGGIAQNELPHKARLNIELAMTAHSDMVREFNRSLFDDEEAPLTDSNSE